MPNEKLTEILQKPIFRKYEKLKAHLSFKDNIWGADLVDMQSISKFNKGTHFFIMCY